MRIPVISLWQPWAQWVVLGWKTIETRTHGRLASLEGRVIGIHAAQKWDPQAAVLAKPYLTDEQLWKTIKFDPEGGAIIGTAMVLEHRRLTEESDSADALIDCKSVERWGLILGTPRMIPPVVMRGGRGIWYADVDNVGEREGD